MNSVLVQHRVLNHAFILNKYEKLSLPLRHKFLCFQLRNIYIYKINISVITEIISTQILFKHAASHVCTSVLFIAHFVIFPSCFLYT